MAYTISSPHNPMTIDNTEGYSDTGLRRMNEAFVEVWNATFADDPRSERDHEDMTPQFEHAVWEALASYWGDDTADCDNIQHAIHWAIDRLAPPRVGK